MFKTIREIAKVFLGKYSTISYSQEGEDLLLKRILDSKSSGFYLEIGAHHPVRFSNTYLLYKSGWSGVCVDPNPENMKLFRKVRPRDTVLEFGVDAQDRSLEYFEFSDSALNTFSPERAELIESSTNYKVVSKRDIPVKNINWIIDQYIGKNHAVDLFCMDIEGFDLNVLRAIDWTRFSPKIVLVEDHAMDLQDTGKSQIHKLMIESGYVFFAKFNVSCVYRKY